jgi:heme/copper-type cytochrome/quinol oxidase subunit 3
MPVSHATASSPLDYSSTGVPTGRVAIWWFIASEIAIFGGAVACYLLYRFAHPEWSEAASHTVQWAGATNTVVLLTSSLMAVLADKASREGDGKGAARYLWFAILGGLVFLGIKTYEYSHEIHAGFTPLSDEHGLFWAFYFLMTGLHAAHVLGGMTAMAVVARGAARGMHLGRVEIAAIYWHFVDVIWIFLFPLLYLAS